jgi:23S rRNA (adenine-N6)-dimethyltransferase
MARNRRSAPVRTLRQRSPRARIRRELSQNFLVDPHAVRRIVTASGVREGDLVWEPGAGDGRLTLHLARRSRHVVAYELDPVPAAALRRRLEGKDDVTRSKVTLRRSDFLCARPPAEPFTVVGNIPYHASTEILRWCLAAPSLQAATLLTQEEFARKHTGGFGRWTRLAVLAWPQVELRRGPWVARRCFRPVPRVDSAVLQLRRRSRPLLPPEVMSDYRRLVEEGFTGKGGSLEATLRRRFGPRRTRAAMGEARVATGTPVGLVTPDQWIVTVRTLLPTR